MMAGQIRPISITRMVSTANGSGAGSRRSSAAARLMTAA